jgi:hypothetical protein
VIDPNQTAYINGRSETDSFAKYVAMKDHCIEAGVNAVLISLDARKALTQ